MATRGIKSAARKSWALAAYRSAVNFGLLVIGFRDFPDHQAFVAFAFLSMSYGTAAIGSQIAILFLTQNHLDDLAERKTRHAILLSHNPAWRDDLGFWSEVDRRVAAEGCDDDERDPIWIKVGLFALSLAGMLVADLITIGLAAIFST